MIIKVEQYSSIISKFAHLAFFPLFCTDWRPGRSLVLCSWDSEEYGLVGSTEYVEVSSDQHCRSNKNSF